MYRKYHVTMVNKNMKKYSVWGKIHASDCSSYSDVEGLQIAKYMVELLEKDYETVDIEIIENVSGSGDFIHTDDPDYAEYFDGEFYGMKPHSEFPDIYWEKAIDELGE